jgi:hypothetical protein
MRILEYSKTVKESFMFINKLIIFLFVLLNLGCSMAQKKYDYMSESEYQSRPKLSQSLLNESDKLSEASIQKILASKITLPKSINLSIVRLSDSTDGLNFQTIDDQISEQFYNKNLWGNRVQTVIPVPQVMISKPVTLASLRQAAALLQSDILVIIKPQSYADWKFQLFDKSKAKGIASLEVLLLDTRTSVVPYTSLITETVEVSRESTEYSYEELISKAKKASERKALLQIPAAVQKFISKLF